MLQILQFIVLIFSIVIHEVAHGSMAKELGDDTAEKMGRLTLNPLSHLDPVGSVILPLLLFISTQGRFVFGWAKPVPYNPLNLKNPAKDSAKIAIAGPAANLLLALVVGIFIRVFGSYFSNLVPFLLLIVRLNILLALFNLVPIPPLDGSKILFFFFPSPKLEIFLMRYSFLLIILFLFFGWGLLWPPINFLTSLFTGL